MNKSLEQYMPDGSKLPYRFMKYRIHKSRSIGRPFLIF